MSLEGHHCRLRLGLGPAILIGLCYGGWFAPLFAMSPADSPKLSAIAPEPGEFYRSHTRIELAAGSSFSIPSDWQGFLPPGSRTFYLESPKHSGVGLVAAIQDATPEELENHLNEPQVIDEGYVLQPLGSASRTAQRITATYVNGDNIGRAIAMFGPSLEGILYLFTGPKEQVEYYDQLLEEIAASTTFLKPSKDRLEKGPNHLKRDRSI